MGNQYERWLCANCQSLPFLRVLHELFDGAEAVFYEIREAKGLEELVGGAGKTDWQALVAQLRRNATEQELYRLEEACSRFLVGFVAKEDDAFPKRLQVLPDCPFGLFYQGRLPGAEQPAISIIGARQNSFYGQEMTRLFSGHLAAAGVDIISGLALGVDGIAHAAALEAGGVTYAVLGSGIGTPYPKENYGLYYDILERQGGILSEYPPYTPGLKYHFPHRNRIISGLAEGILVVEARKRSGTLITADRALEQGREVYVIPGRLTDDTSYGCNWLISQGAKLVMRPEDLLDELQERFGDRLCRQEADGQYYFGGAKGREQAAPVRKEKLTEEEQRIVSCLRRDVKHFDQLSEETGLTAPVLARNLIFLEQRGIVRQPAPNYYRGIICENFE